MDVVVCGERREGERELAEGGGLFIILTVGDGDLPVDRRPQKPPRALAQGLLDVRALGVPSGVINGGYLEGRALGLTP